MFKRLTAQIKNGILYRFALAVTSELVTLMLTRSLFLSLVIFNLINFMNKVKYVVHARNAKNGQYVSIAYAKKHPSTTVIERDRVK